VRCASRQFGRVQYSTVANYLSPYNLASGLLGEEPVMLWLLVIGLNTQKWNELATARRVCPG
jgi:hypothetical protein